MMQSQGLQVTSLRPHKPQMHTGPAGRRAQLSWASLCSHFQNLAGMSQAW